jgi:Zn-dependent protease with chaperone function
LIVLATISATALALSATFPVGGGCSGDCSVGGLYAQHTSVSVIVARAWQEKKAVEALPSALDARHKSELDRDKELGKKYSVEVEKGLKLSKNQEAVDRVQRIGGELAEVANRENVTVLWGDRRLNPFEYTFKVVEGQDVNAFSLPGGYIYIHEGLIKFSESDHELAGVLAHEIAHASFRHVATLQKEAGKLSVMQIPLILAAIFGGTSGMDVLRAGGLAAQAVASGWSQKAEEAADFGGLQYMLSSNYNPTGILTFMERLAKDEQSRPYVNWGIYRTHPPSRERAAALTQSMRTLNLPIRRSQVTVSLKTQVKPGENGIVELWFSGKKLVGFAGTDALDRADAAARRLDVYFDDVPDVYTIRTSYPATILGGAKPLITLLPEDAKAETLSVDDLLDRTVKNLQAAVFNISYRVWSR